MCVYMKYVCICLFVCFLWVKGSSLLIWFACLLVCLLVFVLCPFFFNLVFFLLLLSFFDLILFLKT